MVVCKFKCVVRRCVWVGEAKAGLKRKREFVEGGNGGGKLR